MPAHWRTGCKGVCEVFIGRHQKATSSARVSLENGDKMNDHHDEGGWLVTMVHIVSNCLATNKQTRLDLSVT